MCMPVLSYILVSFVLPVLFTTFCSPPPKPLPKPPPPPSPPKAFLPDPPIRSLFGGIYVHRNRLARSVPCRIPTLQVCNSLCGISACCGDGEYTGVTAKYRCSVSSRVYSAGMACTDFLWETMGVPDADMMGTSIRCGGAVEGVFPKAGAAACVYL